MKHRMNFRKSMQAIEKLIIQKKKELEIHQMIVIKIQAEIYLLENDGDNDHDCKLEGGEHCCSHPSHPQI